MLTMLWFFGYVRGLFSLTREPEDVIEMVKILSTHSTQLTTDMLKTIPNTMQRRITQFKILNHHEEE